MLVVGFNDMWDHGCTRESIIGTFPNQVGTDGGAAFQLSEDARGEYSPGGERLSCGGKRLR